jgi:DNA polymerase-3 subunit delta
MRIRSAARRKGFDEREVLVAEAGFKWDAFVAANATSASFGDRKLIDLRIPSGKPGVDGAKALEACAAQAGADQMLLVSLPKIDRATQGSAWFRRTGARRRRGGGRTRSSARRFPRGSPPVWPGSARAPRPRRSRFSPIGAKATSLRARQEIEKLGLVLPEGELEPEGVERAGDRCRPLRCLSVVGSVARPRSGSRVANHRRTGSRGRGHSVLLWQLGEDIHAIAAVQEAAAAGTPVATALRNARVWGKRQAAMERAARRVPSETVGRFCRRWRGSTLSRRDRPRQAVGRAA